MNYFEPRHQLSVGGDGVAQHMARRFGRVLLWLTSCFVAEGIVLNRNCLEWEFTV